MNLKSQGGIEFLIITGMALLFFTVFFVAIKSNTEDKNKEREMLTIKNLALSIQDEINLAAEASEGYQREFYVTKLILGKEYEIEIIDNRIYIKTEENAISLKVREVIGEIQKEENIIKKQDGKIYLN